MKNERKFQSYKIRIALGLLALMLCTPSLSLGWGAGGHMMVASIAYKRLNPRAKAKVNELLAIPINPANVSAKSKDFVNAAHWADDLRPFAEFDGFKALHFIDTPFSTDGTPTAVHAPTPNIVTALQDNVKILRTSADTNAQAQALRLIIHFVGDIHQPLHCATKVSSANPDGDRGGNLVSIIIPGEGKAKVKKSNLHSYWDGGLGTFPTTGPNFAPPPLSQIPAAAIKAMKDNSANDPQLRLDNPFNFQAWADESFALAKDVAYNGITDSGRLSKEYISTGQRVAQKRVTWGGYRLAALLNAIWP